MTTHHFCQVHLQLVCHDMSGSSPKDKIQNFHFQNLKEMLSILQEMVPTMTLKVNRETGTLEIKSPTFYAMGKWTLLTPVSKGITFSKLLGYVG